MISNIRSLFLSLSADKWQLVVIAVNVSQRYIVYLGFLRPAAQCIDIGLCHSCCFLATIQCRATGPQGGQKIRVNSERRSGKRHTKRAREPESSREARVCQRLGQRKRETATVHAANSWCCWESSVAAARWCIVRKFLRIADTMSAHDTWTWFELIHEETFRFRLKNFSCCYGL